MWADVATASCVTLFEFRDALSLEDKLLGRVCCFIFKPSHVWIFMIHQKWISRVQRLIFFLASFRFWISSFGKGLISLSFEAAQLRPLLRMHIDGGGRPFFRGKEWPKEANHMINVSFYRCLLHLLLGDFYCLTSD